MCAKYFSGMRYIFQSGITIPFSILTYVIIENIVFVVDGFDNTAIEDDEKEETFRFILLPENQCSKKEKGGNKRWKWKLFFCLVFQWKCRNSSWSHRIPSYFTRLDLFLVEAQGCVPPRHIPFHPASFVRIFRFEFLIYSQPSTSNPTAIFASRRPRWRQKGHTMDRNPILVSQKWTRIEIRFLSYLRRSQFSFWTKLSPLLYLVKQLCVIHQVDKKIIANEISTYLLRLSHINPE